MNLRKSRILRTASSHRPVDLDWETVRQKFAAANQALPDLQLAETREQVWARRAARLAQVPARPEEGAHVELLLLRLGRELYGIDVQHVFDIRPVDQITPVPRVPGWVAGVVNLRGRILSVVNLPVFLGLSPAAGEAHDKNEQLLVVVETSDMDLALLVDDVLPIDKIPTNRVQEAGGVIQGIRPEYIQGVFVRENGDSVVILNLAALLADKQLIVYEEIV